MTSRAEVVVSGMRPTGRLHLGNYWGALKNWVDLQSRHRCYFFVADWHMLTTGYEDTSKLRDNTREMVLDWLAAGLEPDKCVIFRQSDVLEHAELALLLGMITSLGWLENNPTWKDQLEQLADRDVRTFGFLGYPILQTADVLLYRGTRVPVGQDQLPHLELSREIARRFNGIYGETFPEPQPILTATPKLPGVDGRKMSKSYGNTLEIYETQESLGSKIKNMYTDPKKLRKNTPGNPDPGPENPPGCVVYALHKLYTPEWEKIGDACRKGELGCMDDKRHLTQVLDKPFAEFRGARERYSAEDVENILSKGAEKAREVAAATMSDVRRAMRLR